MRRTHLAACAAVSAMLVSASGAAANPPDVDSTRLEQLVTVQGITEHQKALQTIADLNGGTRHTRTAGYTASAAYVKATLEKAGYEARYEMFNMPEWRETAAPVLQLTSPSSKTYRAGTAADDSSASVDFIAFEHTPTKAVSGEVVPVGHTEIPADGGSESGCVAADYSAAVKGAIALIQRGTCEFGIKAINAQNAGASAVIIFNQGNTPQREDLIIGTQIGRASCRERVLLGV